MEDDNFGSYLSLIRNSWKIELREDFEKGSKNVFNLMVPINQWEGCKY